MSELIRQLHQDHINVARLLTILERQIEILNEAGAPDYSLMVEIMQYMTHYPDQYHHPKEDLMFDRLAARAGATAPVLKELSEEHEILAEKSGRFLESLQGVLEGGILPRELVVGQGREYVQILMQHMSKEEAQIFIRAEQVLTDADWAAIDRAMKPREDPWFGKNVETRYRERREQILRMLD